MKYLFIAPGWVAASTSGGRRSHPDRPGRGRGAGYPADQRVSGTNGATRRDGWASDEVSAERAGDGGESVTMLSMPRR